MKYNKRYSDEYLLQLIRDFVKKNDRIPYQNEFRPRFGLVHLSTYEGHFNTTNNAIRLAGYEPRAARNRGEHVYSDAELSNKFRDFANKIGAIPTVKEIKESPEMPAWNTYADRYGSLQNILKASGIKHNRWRFWIMSFLIHSASILLSFSEKVRERWTGTR